MSVALAVGAAVAGLVSLGRWLRVSQREHYLRWSALAVARRWARRRPPNAAVAVAWAALAAATLVVSGATGAAGALGLAAAAAGAAWPLGMSVRGSPRLRFTRRATTHAVLAAVVAGVVLAVVASAADLDTAAALAPAVAALAVDVGAWLNAPVERRIAQRYRRAADEKLRRARPRVVAITGSYGKTTVKNHVRDLVAGAFDTLATPASWNNLAGLSRAINEQLTPSTEVFVAEMGTYGPGEIAEMVAWLRPEVAVITAIGPVHLERMGSLEGILAAKAEILEGARAAVLNADSPLLRRLAAERRQRGAPAEVWLAGSEDAGGEVDVVVTPRCAGDEADGGGGDGGELVVQVRGEHVAVVPRGALHPTNVACAVATALALGVDRRVVARGLAALAAPTHRAEVAVTDDGVVVVDDTFNSNPDGARAALATLSRHVSGGRRFVVTPGMVELGPQQFDANRELAEAVAASGAELVVVGWTNRDALLAGCPGAVTVGSREAARRWLRGRLRPGDGVLWENDLPDHYP
jgi:UDP-N-acetylmuramoyl-tripeptide--D-alanyl-D-alanine ligase